MRCLAIDIGGTKIATAIVQHNQVSQRQQIQTRLINHKLIRQAVCIKRLVR